MSHPATPARRGLTALSLAWFGLLLGVSFLATPVKFLAPSLTLAVALDVGRQTFMALNRLELGLGILLVLLALSCRRQTGHPPLTGALGLLLLVLAQSLWLLPLLDARVELILQGGQPPPSALHRVYIGIEALKLVVLGALGWWLPREGPKHSPR